MFEALLVFSFISRHFIGHVAVATVRIHEPKGDFAVNLKRRKVFNNHERTDVRSELCSVVGA